MQGVLAAEVLLLPAFCLYFGSVLLGAKAHRQQLVGRESEHCLEAAL